MAYWLVKSDPEEYGLPEFKKDKKTLWTGVRNYAARLHLRAMKNGEEVFFYHSNEDMALVAIAKISKEAMPDPTAKEGDWSCVELTYVKTLNKPVTLQAIKANKKLADLALVRIGRLSCQPVTDEQWNEIMKMAE